MNEAIVEIAEEQDIVACRQAGRTIAREAGLGSADQTRLATAISELARNVVQYALPGRCVVRSEVDGRQVTIHVEVEDQGPGIPSVEQALADGFSTGGGLGAGLPGTRRLMDELRIESAPGHTRIHTAMRRRLPS